MIRSHPLIYELVDWFRKEEKTSHAKIVLAKTAGDLRSEILKPELFLNYKVKSIEDATDHLLNLSPFEMKTLLDRILSGKEMGATSIYFINMHDL
ncbi:putative phosphorylase b kinase regulatory subunit alpha [Brachionus plicatilis]|uniref:Putative phosphorylase b kinase regulatory subunit alpha n=1 Tax=Brachionus plicatilis TaxID=10195 RepID=A0A3M7R7X2_BRAPC|nr:putative phosphorylase b kinase regulatory subunit alpha [Brachionus plicatilis]